MLTSIAIILLLGMFMGWLFSKIKLPSLLGMIITGILLGPHAFNIIDSSILSISSDLRQIALVIILTRAGLSLNISDLKKVGRPAFLMCFVPACIEILGTIIFAPLLLGVTILDAAIIGSVIAAVSPAVVVPRMISLIENGYGVEKGIPQLILAGASVDDVFVIIIFTALTSLASVGTMSKISLLQIPISIMLGIFIGILTGFFLTAFFKKFHMRDSAKLLITQIAITSWTRRGRQPRSRMEPQALSGIEGAAAVRLRIQRPGTIQTTPPGCGSRAFCGAVRSARQQRRGYPRR